MTVKGQLGRFSVRQLATDLRNHVARLLVAGADAARTDEALGRYGNQLERTGLDAGKAIAGVIWNLRASKDQRAAAGHLMQLCFMARQFADVLADPGNLEGELAPCKP